MRHIYFLPGILGTELYLNNKRVWPPELCKLFSDAEVLALLDDAIVPGDIIRDLLGVHQIYSPIIDSLTTATQGNANDVLHLWPYDWRKDLVEMSAHLVEDLAAITGTTDEIILIAHSMGGLIVRGALENPANSAAAWQAKVTMAIFLATPHDGATNAITEVSGTDSVGGLTKAQSKLLNSKDKYPAAYQLLPPLDTPSIWGAAGLPPLPFDDPATWATLGLRWSARQKLADFRALLDPQSRPADRRYFAVVSAAHDTQVRMLPTGATPAYDGHKDPTSGDGTVPIESATALRCQTLFVTADHVGVAGSEDTLAFVNQLLGFATLTWAFERTGPTPARLSLSPKFLSPGDPWEMVLLPGDGGLTGAISIQAWSGKSDVGPETTIPVAVTAAGAKSLTLAGPKLAAGQYRVLFRPNSGTASSPQFVIVRG